MYLAPRVERLNVLLGMDSEKAEEELELERDRANARQMAALHSSTAMGPDYRRARQLLRSRRREVEE
jgi:hypothetical protein